MVHEVRLLMDLEKWAMPTWDLHPPLLVTPLEHPPYLE